MIRVVITGPPSGTGWFPYKVDFWWKGGRPQLVGLSKAPLLDACRRLKQYGLMDDTVVGLFDEGPYKDEWRLRTTVGYGASKAVREDDKAGPVEVRFRPFPSDLKARPADAGGAQDALELDAGIPATSEEEMPYRAFPGGPLIATPNDATPATPAAPPPQPHTPPGPIADKGPVPPAPSKSTQSHHKRKRAGSGARRGSR